MMMMMMMITLENEKAIAWFSEGVRFDLNLRVSSLLVQITGSRDSGEVIALACHHCVPGSISEFGDACGLPLLGENFSLNSGFFLPSKTKILMKGKTAFILFDFTRFVLSCVSLKLYLNHHNYTFLASYY